MSDTVSAFRVDKLEEFGALHRPVYILNNVAYNSIDIREQRGFLCKFVDKDGNESRIIRLAPITKFQKG